MGAYVKKQGVYVRENAERFDYSDGDAVEDNLRNVICNASDRSVYSEELVSRIVDWPSLYYFSPQRSALLVPFARLIRGKKVLEIGCGLGAITRGLVEFGADVTALDGSFRRVSIAMNRCSDYPDAKFYCDNFEDFELDEKFDLVTLIGVLEYAAMFIKADHPYEAMLKKAKSFLKPDGHLLIAIENKLGIKYFNNSLEDHVSVPFFGIQNLYEDNGVHTYGKKELSSILRNAGYDKFTFHYPFPDYKLPTLYLHPAAFSAQGLNVPDLLNRNMMHYNNSGGELFYEDAAAGSLYYNGILEDCANSFVVVTGESDEPGANICATRITPNRKKEATSIVQIVNDESGLAVIRSSLPEFIRKDEIGRPRDRQPYFEGELLFVKMQKMFARKACDLNDLKQVFSLWVNFLKEHLIPGTETLPAHFWDCTPFNLIVQNGKLVFFDQEEGENNKPIPIAFVIFRGIFYTFTDIPFLNLAPELPRNTITLTKTVADTFGVQVDIEDFLLFEHMIQKRLLMSYPRSIDLLRKIILEMEIPSSLKDEYRILQQKYQKTALDLQSLESQYQELFSSRSFRAYKLVHRIYHKLFPRESIRGRALRITVKSGLFLFWGIPCRLWNMVVMLPKTFRCIRENGLRFTLKKIVSFFRAEQGCGWIFDSEKYARICTPEEIPSHVAAPEKISVIVPVYNGLEHLKRLMPSLLANTPANVSILMIDDCSPDDEVYPFLQSHAARDRRIKLQKNPQNYGFVKTVNTAFDICKDQEYVILLNTDTEVPPQWVERLLAPFEKDPGIASVTPFSNGATIFSMPLADDRNNRDFIKVLSLEEIDREIRKYSLPPEMRTAPCGVGFCMAMKNELIRTFGGFDEESFGRGFGEEVDWCRRLADHGYKNVIAPNLFVSHYHGGSFLSAERQTLLEEHEKTVLKKHPDYHVALERYNFETAPAWESIRCAATLGLMLKPENEPVLILDHDWGGGANLYREKVSSELQEGGNAVLLVQPKLGYMIINAYWHDLHYSFRIQDFATLRLPCFSGIKRIIINQLISWTDVYGKRVFSIDLYRKLIEDILSLKENTGARLEYMVHDFFLICPHLNLVGTNRVYCNPGSSADACAGCIAVRRQYERSERYIGTITGELWRDTMNRLIKNLDELRFFSQNTIDVIRQVYDLDERCIKLAPHKPIINFKPMLFNRKPIHIGCVGSIGKIKGADFIVDLAKFLKKNAPDVKIVVIGIIIDYSRLPDNVIVHGKYELSELPRLLDRYGVNVGFISSIWPETFSYVTQELMMLDLPLVCFDIGAPRDRIGKWEKGRIIPKMTPGSAWATIKELYQTCYQG